MSRAGGQGGLGLLWGGDGTHLLQEILDAVSILSTEDVPQGTGPAAGIPKPLLQQRIHAIVVGLQEQVCG